MSLTITIDRTEAGLFRAKLAEDPRLVIEHADFSGLVEERKRDLDMILVTPEGKLLLVQMETGADAVDAVARNEVERGALRNEELDELVDRYPVPVEWGQEPGWSDEL